MSTQTQMIEAIKGLESSHKKQLNRLLACEALLYSLLARLDHQALAGVSEEYDLALDRLAEQLPPSLQMPEMWQGFALALADRRNAGLPPEQETGAD